MESRLDLGCLLSRWYWVGDPSRKPLIVFWNCSGSVIEAFAYRGQFERSSREQHHEPVISRFRLGI